MENRGGGVFLDFVFYKLRPEAAGADGSEREDLVGEFVGAVHRHGELVRCRSYATFGLRADADFLLWLISGDVRHIQDLLLDLQRTRLGRSLTISHAFLSMKRPSPYFGSHAQAFERDLPPLPFLIVYPFVKSREWYLLPFEERKRMMEEHRSVGMQFPSVRLNTTYSFGLGDQDFVLAFETDRLEDFQSLIMRLRETRASRYTVRDTPMMVCVLRELREILESLVVARENRLG